MLSVDPDFGYYLLVSLYSDSFVDVFAIFNRVNLYHFERLSIFGQQIFGPVAEKAVSVRLGQNFVFSNFSLDNFLVGNSTVV